MGLRRDVAGRAIDGALADEYSSEANERWLSGNGPTTVNFHGRSNTETRAAPRTKVHEREESSTRASLRGGDDEELTVTFGNESRQFRDCTPKSGTFPILKRGWPLPWDRDETRSNRHSGERKSTVARERCSPAETTVTKGERERRPKA